MIHDGKLISLELQHHGVKGMRWGVRRYQKKNGSLTSAGRKRANAHQSKSAVKKKGATSAKRAETPDEFEARKKKALTSGSARDVLKFKGKLTNKELQEAVNRIDMERKLSQISKQEVKTGMDKIESVMSTVDRATNVTKKGIEAYNTIARISNSLGGSELPRINT